MLPLGGIAAGFLDRYCRTRQHILDWLFLVLEDAVVPINPGRELA